MNILKYIQGILNLLLFATVIYAIYDLVFVKR